MSVLTEIEVCVSLWVCVRQRETEVERVIMSVDSVI